MVTSTTLYLAIVSWNRETAQHINADFIKHCSFVRIDTDLVSKAIFLLALIFIRDGSFVLPGNGLSSVELSACIRHVC
jgi:hypothetical protein